jgi:hypothetical protein
MLAYPRSVWKGRKGRQVERCPRKGAGSLDFDHVGLTEDSVLGRRSNPTETESDAPFVRTLSADNSASTCSVRPASVAAANDLPLGCERGPMLDLPTDSGTLSLQPRHLLLMFDIAYLIALSAWVGAVLFFLFGVAPLLFRVLGAEAGGRFVRALLPRYYAWGVVCGAIALPAFVGAPLTFPEYKGVYVGLQAFLILACILIFLYGGNTLTPAIIAALDLGPEGSERFDRLQQRSVRLNIFVLVVGMGLLVAQAARRPPQNEGIKVRSPDSSNRR